MFSNISSLKSSYCTNTDDIGNNFYNPVLRVAKKFDRTTAYFSAKALAQYSEGLEYFVKKGSKYRLIVSEEISIEDYELIKEGYSIRADKTDDMLARMKEDLSISEEKNISNLAYLIGIGVVDIKIAFMKKGIFHDKSGILYDDYGNIICFTGSNNETYAAIQNNYEKFILTCNWITEGTGFYQDIITNTISDFEKLWNDELDGIIVKEAENVIMNEIIKHDKDKIITETTFLEEDCVVLDINNDDLVLIINTDDIFWILNGAFYKIRLKRYIDNIEDDIIHFKKDLTYTDFQKIHELFLKQSHKKDKRYFMSEKLKDYIESKNIYIHKRSNLGIDIKNQNENVRSKFEEYSEVVNNSMSRDLREKQMWDSFFMYTMIKSGNFSVPGSGKTAAALGVYAFLKSREEAKRIVMIGPKNAFGSWIDEFNLSFDGKEELNVFNIHDPSLKTNEQKKFHIRHRTRDCNMLLFNYESVETYLDEIKKCIDKDTILIFDEVHKVKKIDGVRATQALEIAKGAKYTIAMTGTPIPNSYSDLYNMLNILFNDEYKNFFGFSHKELSDSSEDILRDVNDKIQPFFCRTTKQQLSVPKVNDDILLEVSSSPAEQKIFEILTLKYKQDQFTLLIRLLQLESNPRMLLSAIDIEDFESILDINKSPDDIDFIDYSKEIRDLIDSIELTSKMKKTLEQTEKLVTEGKTVIIWCFFKDSINNIHKLLSDRGICCRSIFGEVEMEDRLEIIDSFKEGGFDVLITNPHTLAESVSLHTACHDAIYFEYSYNLVHLLQSKDRIHRLGLPENQYTQYYYLQQWFEANDSPFSIGYKIYDRLMEKEQTMLNAIDNNELEGVTSSDEDLKFIFSTLFD